MAETQAEREALINATDGALENAWHMLKVTCLGEPEGLATRCMADASQAVLNLLTIRRFLEAESNMQKANEAMKDVADKMATMLREPYNGPKPPSH